VPAPAPVEAAAPGLEVSAPPPAPRIEETVIEAVVVPPFEEKRGFWSRLFGRSKSPEDDLVAEAEAILEPADGDLSGPLTVERRVQVPITLAPEETARGVRLRLVLDLRVRPSEQGRSRAA